MKSRIFFRADGNNAIGLGHVFRSLALVEILSREFECGFIIKQPDPAITAQIAAYCKLYPLPLVSIQEETAHIAEIVSKQDILVLDNYSFNVQQQLDLKQHVCKLVALDDKAEVHFYADLVINHGGAALKDKYETEDYTKLLLGFDYLLLRKPFRVVAGMQRSISKIDSLFICMGGADPFNATNKVLRAALQCHFIQKIVVVTGSAYLYTAELLAIIAENKEKIQHESNVGAELLVQLIGMCAIAVCPSSSISLEICCVKAGLLTGVVIDNQYGLHDQLIQSGCAISAGNFNEIDGEAITASIHQLHDPEKVKSIISNQARAIDGRSAERLLAEFKSLAVC